MTGGADTVAGSQARRLARRAAAESVAVQERCELCGAPIPARAPSPARPGDARAALRVPPVQPAVRPRRGRRRPLPAGARPAAAPGRLRARRRRLGRAATSPSTWRSSSTTPRAGRVVAFYPGPMGATESLLELRAWTRAGGAEPGAARAASPTWRRCSSTGARGAPRSLAGPDRRVLFAGGPDPHRWRGFTGGREVWEKIGQFFEQLDRPRRSRRHANGNRKDGDMTDNLKVGQARRRTGRSVACPGIKHGQRERQLREQRGPQPRRHARRQSARPASTRSSGTRSIRGCRTCLPPEATEQAGRCQQLRHGRQPRSIRCSTFSSASKAPECSRMRRCRRCVSRCASKPPASGRSARSCWTCRSRSPRGGARTTMPSRSGCSSCSASRSAGARRCARCRGRAVSQVVPAFTGETVVDLRRAVHLRLRGDRREVPAGARRRGGPARVPVQRDGLLHGRGGRAADGAHQLGPRGRVPRCRSRCGARRWTTTSPAAPGCGFPGTRSTGCTPTGRATRCRAGSTPSTRCCRRRSGGG